MAKLIYMAITSLDGYIEDEAGKFDWGMPSDEVGTFTNDLVRPIGTYLYGRRMYETMAYWEAPDATPSEPSDWLDFARIWEAADKIVYSKTLAAVYTRKTRLEREFDPEAVREMKAQSPRDITVNGPTLATHAVRAGLVDEYHLFLTPIILGGGKPSLPRGVRVKLELLNERRFENGMVYLHYRVGS